jgi:hypothetical protein
MQTPANRQTKSAVKENLDVQSQMCRTADMASAAEASTPTTPKLNSRPHSREKNREATAWSTTEMAGAGETMAEIDATTTAATSEETMPRLTVETTGIRATAEAIDLHTTETA